MVLLLLLPTSSAGPSSTGTKELEPHYERSCPSSQRAQAPVGMTEPIQEHDNLGPAGVDEQLFQNQKNPKKPHRQTPEASNRLCYSPSACLAVSVSGALGDLSPHLAPYMTRTRQSILINEEAGEASAGPRNFIQGTRSRASGPGLGSAHARERVVCVGVGMCVWSWKMWKKSSCPCNVSGARNELVPSPLSV